MRLFSNPQSVRFGELSALAIAETMAASGLSFWLAWRLGSIQHIVLASALVPFLLLRTRLSTRYAVRLYAQTDRWSDSLIFDAAADTLAVPCAKIFATTKVFFRKTIKSVQAIPANFMMGIAVLDLCCPPQFFPGLELEKTKYFDSYELVRRLFKGQLNILIGRSHRNPIVPWIVFLRFLPVKIIAFLPMIILALAYRWALKSTAVLWLPLIWIVIQARPGTQVMARLVVMTRSAWSKVMLVYSALVLLAFIAKLALLFGIWHFANLDWLGQLGVAATQLVAPFELPIWQLAGAANALLAWLFFFHVDQHILAQGTTEAWPEGWVRGEYAIYQVVRTTLSLYVIACTFYITAAVAWQTEWPPIRFVLFPWAA